MFPEGPQKNPFARPQARRAAISPARVPSRWLAEVVGRSLSGPPGLVAAVLGGRFKPSARIGLRTSRRRLRRSARGALPPRRGRRVPLPGAARTARSRASPRPGFSRFSRRRVRSRRRGTPPGPGLFGVPRAQDDLHTTPRELAAHLEPYTAICAGDQRHRRGTSFVGGQGASYRCGISGVSHSLPPTVRSTGRVPHPRSVERPNEAFAAHGPVSVLVRVVVSVRRHILGEQLLLLRDVVLDRGFEQRVADLVRAVGQGRKEPSRQLVLALGAGLE